MRKPRPYLLVFTALVFESAGCRRAVEPPKPLALDEEYCWWTALRTPLSVDTVAARFERAFTTAGLTNAASTRAGDTVWVHAGPTLSPVDGSDVLRAARAVAYRAAGDTTRFRYFVALQPAPGGSTTASAASKLGGARIGFCKELAGAARVPSSAPGGVPSREDSLAVWRAR